jgi:thiamine-monophosphate kinase
MTDVQLGPGPEFDAIRAMAERWGALATGLGDDSAVLDVPVGERLCVSTDSSVENVHFRRDWLQPREIGYRATAAALSDLAAMAARPLGMLVAMTVPVAWRESLLEIADGIADAARAADAAEPTPILGGDITAGDALSLTITVLGSAAHPVSRSGAQPGDTVYITGAFGGPLAALRALEPTTTHWLRFARPVPRIREARWLAERGARAMVDISDGLVADLGHLAIASGVRISIALERVPIAREPDPRTGAWSVVDPSAPPSSEAAENAARSGEEYELALAAPRGVDVAAFVREFGLPLTAVGEVRALAAGESPGVDATFHGRRVDQPRGHDHFTS